VIVKQWILGVFVAGACGVGCATAAADRCASDTDCKGARVCSSGICVDPTSSSGGDAGTTDSGNNSNNNNNNSCNAVGATCTATASCCQSGSGIGPSGAICISNDNLCHAACASNAECQSGCCAPVQGQALGVCAAASECAPTCVGPGGGCSVSTDCCQSGTNVPYGATCLTDDFTCHDVCYASSDCSSGCCIQLQGLSYGACGSAGGHICL
jgi:hypothetical protein